MNPARALERHWFAPAPAERLALMRILVGLWTLRYVGKRRRMLRRIVRSDPALFRPVGPVRPLTRPISPAAADALVHANQIATAAFVLGWRHPVSGPLYGASLLLLLSYRTSWSMIYHSNNVLVLHALVLGLAPSADALSLDSRRRPAPKPSWSYGWPLRLMNATTVATYFLAAVAKLKGPLGWRWATGEALRSQVEADALRKQLLGVAPPALASRMHDHVAVYRALAVGSMLIEAGAPLVLVHRRLAQLWALGAFGMHWGIFAIMRIRFRYQMAGLIFAPFFELERLLPRAGRR
jgi:hypothetical protein